jgi:lysine 2,3-aminomutase
VETGINIIQGMRGFTSGLAVPTYVIDLPDGGGKIPVQPDYILERNSEELTVRNYQGKIIHYPNPGVAKVRSPHSELLCDDAIPA